MIKVRGHELDIDVAEEIQDYDWHRGRPRGEEFTACSPFRSESSPSFSINLDTGKWIDFGAANNGDLYSKGGIVTLLSFLRNETPEEVEDYLLDKYGINLSNVDDLSLNLDLSIEDKKPKVFSLEEYKQYAYRNNYLETRGISEKVQRAFKVGFDRKNKAVALPWMDKDGNIINIKFRSTKSKQFYYAAGQPIRNHLYGINHIYKLRTEVAYIVESEIDCLYLWSHGYPAIALGGSNLSEKQRQLLLRSPVKKLVVATDNDAVGKEIKKKIINAVVGYKELYEISLPDSVKDVNDLIPQRLPEVLNNYSSVTISLF